MRISKPKNRNGFSHRLRGLNRWLEYTIIATRLPANRSWLTKPPRVDLPQLNLGDLCVLLCGPLFGPVVRDFAQKLPKIAQVSQAAIKPSSNSPRALSQNFADL
jgi:hypothetical protein